MDAPSPEDCAQYWRDRTWLEYALHELPAGVLFGANGATQEECRELMEGLDSFDRLCQRLGLSDHVPYIEACRWHFDHYPHYLGRSRHFDGYASYATARGGSLRVGAPPDPGFPRPMRQI